MSLNARWVATVLIAVACSAPAPRNEADVNRSAQRVRSANLIALQIDSSARSMRVDSISIPEASSEGASVEALSDAGRIRRLAATYFGEGGRATELYYFDSSLVLVVRREYRYDRPLTGRVVDSLVTRIDVRADPIAKSTRDSLLSQAAQLAARFARLRQ